MYTKSQYTAGTSLKLGGQRSCYRKWGYLRDYRGCMFLSYTSNYFIWLTIFSSGFQILYPTALAAAIFSMQPGAIPFDLPPRSFALAVFVLIATVYAIRLIGRHTQLPWPLLQNPISLVLKRKKVDESVNKFSVNRFGDTFSSPTGISLDRVDDEERNGSISNDDRACGTREICGPSITGLEP
jgi:hypothetical protein